MFEYPWLHAIGDSDGNPSGFWLAHNTCPA